MKIKKYTPDRCFALTIESTVMDEVNHEEQIPVRSLEQLIMELEMLAVELRLLLLDHKKDNGRAN